MPEDFFDHCLEAQAGVWGPCLLDKATELSKVCLPFVGASVVDVVGFVEDEVGGRILTAAE